MNERGPILSRLTARQVVWLAATVSFATYLPTLLDGFVSEDRMLVSENAYAHELGHVFRCFGTDFWDTPFRPNKEASTLFYRPLVCAANVVNWKLGFGTAFSFHLVNVLAHAGACALAARTAIRWTRSNLAGLVATLLFALHPSRSHSVTFVSGRDDVFMALAFFAAEELAVRASRRETDALATWLRAAGAFATALLSKEFAIFWPLWLAVEAAVAHDRERASSRRKLLLAGSAALVASLAYLTLRALALPFARPELTEMTLPGALRVAYALMTVGYYAERIVFPFPHTFHFRPLTVAAFHGEPALHWPSVVLGAAVTAALFFWIYRAWKRDRTLAYILVTGTLMALPVLNIVHVGVRNVSQDRFLYMPLFVFAVAAARDVRRPLERWSARSRVPAALVGAGVLGCAVVNWSRAFDYASNEAFFRHELEVNPEDPAALVEMARVVSSQGDTDGAIAFLNRSVAPGALAYRLLANPTETYVARLELQGPRLADGYVSALSALLGHTVNLVRGARLYRAQAGDLELRAPQEQDAFRVHVANAAAGLAASGALVASRIGRDDLVRLLIASVDEKAPIDVAARYNLALALARSGDYSGARRQLAIGAALPAPAGMEQSFTAFGSLLESVKEQRLRATSLPEPQRSLARAKAFLELGAYLRAARALREAYQVAPDDPAVRMTYFEALVNARLETDAKAVAEKTFAPEQVKAELDAAEHRVSSQTARAIPPPPDERWWLRPPGVREE